MNAAEWRVSHDLLLENARRDYERRGYRFLAEPPEEMLPERLRMFRPDAVALGPSGNVAVAVKRGGPRQSGPTLAELARRVGEEPGWTLDVIYVPERPEEAQRLHPPSIESIGQQLEEATQLLAARHTRAALLLGWAILESLLRIRAGGTDERTLRPLTAFALAEQAAMDGLIEPEDADRLRRLARLRNAVAHGDFNVEVAEEDVAWLLAVLRRAAVQPTP